MDRKHKKLAEIHIKYWIDKPDESLEFLRNFSPSEIINPIDDLDDKLYKAFCNTSHDSIWKNTFNSIMNRFKNCPKTIIHGDLIPTNIIINNKVTFIDWANSGEFPYFMDIARFTGLIDEKTGNPFCPCQDEIYKEYYNHVKEKLNIPYEKYLLDICMGQFIELASIYFPPVGLNAHSPFAKSKFNILIESKLNQLSARIAELN